MLLCEQSPGQTVYQHGQSVREHFHDLIDETPQKEWRLPNWFKDYKNQLIANLHPIQTIDFYTIYHDISKPYVRQVDEAGKVHFPDHARQSSNIVLAICPMEELAADLIGYDMVLHTASSELLNQYFQEWTVEDASTLLIAAIAEIHSNAKLFGGLDSQSFKIKARQLDRRGKQLCKYFFSNRKEV
jgi:hypothetical protein